MLIELAVALHIYVFSWFLLNEGGWCLSFICPKYIYIYIWQFSTWCIVPRLTMKILSCLAIDVCYSIEHIDLKREIFLFSTSLCGFASCGDQFWNKCLASNSWILAQVQFAFLTWTYISGLILIHAKGAPISSQPKSNIYVSHVSLQLAPFLVSLFVGLGHGHYQNRSMFQPPEWENSWCFPCHAWKQCLG